MPEQELTALRESFNKIDNLLLALLAERAKLSMRVALVKDHLGLQPEQPGVWEAAFLKRLTENQEFQLDESYLRSLFDCIHRESLRIQKTVLAN